MKKGAEPPSDTVEYPDIPAPPYPGPPLDSNVVVSLPTPDGQPPLQPDNQHQKQPEPQPIAQQYNQPQPQPIAQQQIQSQPQPQLIAQQYNQPQPQPIAQQYNQPVAQQYQQPFVQQCAQPGQQMVVQYVTQPMNQVVVTQPRPTDASGTMLCPHCQNMVRTSVEYKIGALTWIIVGVLFILVCWPCCLIPFCVNSCKDVQHSCPTCNNVLHVHKQI